MLAGWKTNSEGVPWDGSFRKKRKKNRATPVKLSEDGHTPEYGVGGWATDKANSKKQRQDAKNEKRTTKPAPHNGYQKRVLVDRCWTEPDQVEEERQNKPYFVQDCII